MKKVIVVLCTALIVNTILGNVPETEAKTKITKTIKVGERFFVTLKGKGKVKYSFSKKDIISVKKTKKGIYYITGKKSGFCTITFKSGKKKCICNVKVKANSKSKATLAPVDMNPIGSNEPSVQNENVSAIPVMPTPSATLNPAISAKDTSVAVDLSNILGGDNPYLKKQDDGSYRFAPDKPYCFYIDNINIDFSKVKGIRLTGKAPANRTLFVLYSTGIDGALRHVLGGEPFGGQGIESVYYEVNAEQRAILMNGTGAVIMIEARGNSLSWEEYALILSSVEFVSEG